MRRASRAFLIAAGVALPLLGAVVVAWHVLQKPRARVPPPLKVTSTPERVARGKYLVENVCGCFGCHAQTAVDRYGMPPKPGTEGMGQVMPGILAGATITASNITGDPEVGLAGWSDGEIARAIREGVGRDGRALFPLMPYESFRVLSDEDLASIIAYLRQLPPVHEVLPPTELPFPLPFFIARVPRPLDGPVPDPPADDTVARGRYLATIAGCRDCHTPVDAHERLLEGKEFFGGRRFALPGATVVSANITPHPSTWVGAASRRAFVARLRAAGRYAPGEEPVTGVGINTVMPWTALGRMTEDDLGAIYDYLHTVTPSDEKIVTRPAATAE